MENFLRKKSQLWWGNVSASLCNLSLGMSNIKIFFILMIWFSWHVRLYDLYSKVFCHEMYQKVMWEVKLKVFSGLRKRSFKKGALKIHSKLAPIRDFLMWNGAPKSWKIRPFSMEIFTHPLSKKSTDSPQNNPLEKTACKSNNKAHHNMKRLWKSHPE